MIALVLYPTKFAIVRPSFKHTNFVSFEILGKDLIFCWLLFLYFLNGGINLLQ